MDKSKKDSIKVFLLVLWDAVCIHLSYIFATLIRFDFKPASHASSVVFDVLKTHWIVLLSIKLLIYFLVGLYRSLWKYASIDEMVQVVIGCTVSNALCIAYFAVSFISLPRSIYAISFLLDVAFAGGSRFMYRAYRNYKKPGYFNARHIESGGNLVPGIEKEKRILLVGCGEAGSDIIKDINTHHHVKQRVVAAVDDNAAKRNMRISGVKIIGNRYDIPRIASKYKIDEIIIAMPSAGKKVINDIVEICHTTNCRVRILPSYIDLIDGNVSVKSLRDIDIEDLLGRDPVKLDNEAVSGYLKDKVVLVTGAGGSIGSELCRQVSRYSPRTLVIFDIYENSLFEIQNELREAYPDMDIRSNIGSVRDIGRIEELFMDYHPQVIFHAAAHKHVPLMEDNPKEAVINNALGTKNVMDMAEKYQAERFILISTDKAVNPTNVMGASKRMCEMIMQNKAQSCSTTTFAAVRFGNVLGSNGSVIPSFRKQILAGGPVTVTHKEITRFFMTIPEAVQLVIQAGAMAKGGEIFILDMGQPVKILDLAEKLIRLSGFEPYVDIDIKITGLRPGEKLYEELLMAEEGIQDTKHDKIFVGHPISITPEFKKLLDEPGALHDAAYALRPLPDEEVKAWVAKMVPTYKETSNR